MESLHTADQDKKKPRFSFVSQLQRQVKIGKGKQVRKVLFLCLAVFICGGYLFFFNSQRLLPGGVAYHLTQLNTAVEIDTGISLKVMRWDYAPEQGIAEIEVQLTDNTFSSDTQYQVGCYAREGKGESYPIAYLPIVEDSDYFVIQMAVPKRFGELIFAIAPVGSENVSNFYTNAETIRVVDEIEAKTREGYLQERMLLSIESYEQEVKELQEQEQMLQERMAIIKERNAALESELMFKTDTELAEVQQQMQNNSTALQQAEAEAVQNRTRQEELKALIAKTKKQYEEVKAGTYKETRILQSEEAEEQA